MITFKTFLSEGPFERIAKLKEYQKKYRDKNREKVRERQKNWLKEKRKNNPEFVEKVKVHRRTPEEREKQNLYKRTKRKKLRDQQE